MPGIAFHRTSTRPIPLKLVPTLLGIIINVSQAHGDARFPPLRADCMMDMKFSQFPGLGRSYRVAARSHILRCLALI